MSHFFKLLSGLLVIFVLGVSIYTKHRIKIYDCFLFFNELELLKIRFEELYSTVDYFVLVESVETHQGRTKPLFFKENMHLFEKYRDKIVHVVLEDRLNTNDPWVRENFQRNQIMRGLKACQDKDIIMISDLDEIIRPSKIKDIVSPLKSQKRKHIGTSQRMYKFFLNRFDEMWHGTVATTYGYLKKTSPQYIRNLRNKGEHVEDAGWHFTYLGGLDRIITKIEAFAHSEGNTPEGKDKGRLAHEMDGGIFEKIDNSFPKYVVDHRDELMELGFIR